MIKQIIKSKVSSETLVRYHYYKVFKRRLRLNPPILFSEKIQYIKLYDKNPLYSTLVDKVEVKKYVSKVLGNKDNYIIPTLGVWDSFDQIDFNELPKKFVLKCNHDSGSYIIVKDKEKLDKNFAKTKLEKALNKNFYEVGREWAYKNVTPKIMAEKYIEDSKTKDLNDYKFYCFNGKVDCVMICTERDSGNTKFYFFDKQWKFKKYNTSSLQIDSNFTLPKPEKFDEMITLAEKLSTGLKFVRIDLYYVNGSIYFGEYTLYPLSGYDANLLAETDKYFGSKIDL
ncbi:glycosyl transferase [Vagococcus lutrae]|uniref:ATP-grasp fold amidoligase family protein n=1 Tax=Vagococcus lutrae TaxID=81947 RepID=UPI00200FA3AA|nr:ATP-grasp fold amidoligase family protein [Vagococcus lutrae]UQF24036.1 glycosyl transferase [Vagococcus lutrae]UQF63873.1 glycosyl transferase [Vagococcus lutrae]